MRIHHHWTSNPFHLYRYRISANTMQTEFWQSHGYYGSSNFDFLSNCIHIISLKSYNFTKVLHYNNKVWKLFSWCSCYFLLDCKIIFKMYFLIVITHSNKCIIYRTHLPHNSHATSLYNNVQALSNNLHAKSEKFPSYKEKKPYPYTC